MISDEAVEAAARVFYHLKPNGTPLIREREQARAALEAALPHLLASQSCGTGHSGDAGSLPALPEDVVNLVIAARVVAYEVLATWARGFDDLDKALEAFADRVGWENEPNDDGGEAVHALAEREGSRDEHPPSVARVVEAATAVLDNLSDGDFTSETRLDALRQALSDHQRESGR